MASRDDTRREAQHKSGLEQIIAAIRTLLKFIHALVTELRDLATAIRDAVLSPWRATALNPAHAEGARVEGSVDLRGRVRVTSRPDGNAWVAHDFLKPAFTDTGETAEEVNPIAVRGAAVAPGLKNVCTGVHVSLAAVGFPEAGYITLVLRDGATGVGPILWQMRCSLLFNRLEFEGELSVDLEKDGTAAGDITGSIDFGGVAGDLKSKLGDAKSFVFPSMWVEGTANTAMTLEMLDMAGFPPMNTEIDIWMQGTTGY